MSRPSIEVADKGYTTGANLLSATFTDANIVGHRLDLGLGHSVGGDQRGNHLFVRPHQIQQCAAEGFCDQPDRNQLGLGQSDAGSAMNTFDAESGGAFSADTGAIGSTVPEPETWALLTAGFAGIGIGARRRRGTKAPIIPS